MRELVRSVEFKKEKTLEVNSEALEPPTTGKSMQSYIFSIGIL